MSNILIINGAKKFAHSNGQLNDIILKKETLKQAMDKGDVKVSGDRAKLEEMLSYMDTFDFWFNIVTP